MQVPVIPQGYHMHLFHPGPWPQRFFWTKLAREGEKEEGRKSGDGGGEGERKKENIYDVYVPFCKVLCDLYSMKILNSTQISSLHRMVIVQRIKMFLLLKNFLKKISQLRKLNNFLNYQIKSFLQSPTSIQGKKTGLRVRTGQRHSPDQEVLF